MPQLQDRNQARSEELYEFPFVGPFGGVQSELPPDLIEGLGFLDSQNILFRKGVAYARPAFNTVAGIPNPQEALIGVANFFNKPGTEIQGVFTPTRLLRWNGVSATWTPVTGTAFTGASSNLFQTAVVNYKLCFSNGIDPVKTWDGIGTTYLDVANAVPARYLMELDTHLVVANTVELGTALTQRVRYTGAGDPTDWTSFNAGAYDAFNSLGPINGLAKLYQAGYLMHQLGITQVIPTGIGVNPFRFAPLTSKGRGCISPYSLATFGEELATYVGKDNIYTFDGSNSIPIGDSRIDGRRRVGARSRIFADLSTINPVNALAWITTTVNGQPFNAYWLVIPGVNTWVYNFDENNWTGLGFAKTISIMGDFLVAGLPRIADLIGPISSQMWSPATLTIANPFESLFLGASDGTPGVIDFTGNSEAPWSLTTGNLYHGDRRHTKALKKCRLVVQDRGAVVYTITVTNSRGESQTRTETIGNGGGSVLTRIFSFGISGIWLKYVISGSAGAPGAIVEFTPIYDIGGEQRGGIVDG